MNANHHNVCKFASRQDQNYISVSSVIRDFVKLVTSKAAISISRRPSTVQSFESIRKRLSGLIDTPERYKADLECDSQLYVPGSCDWILDDLHFRGWLSDDSLEPSILKLSGSPGSGKSVMAGFLVTHLEEIQKNVQYFFFRYNEEAKRSIAVCLKMLAYQIALCMPEYRRKILPLLEDKNALARNDARGVWQRAFVNILAKMDLDEPLFWVIDAVDECESAQILLNLLPALKEQSIPVKIIFLTRPQASLSAFERLRYKFGSDFRQTEVVPTREGQKLFIEQELEGAYGEWPQNFVNNVKDDLLRKSKGNFLWLTLVTEELRRCATEKPLEEVLSQPPEDLVGVYSRIVNSIAKTYSEGELQTAKRILIWITCAESQLSLGELEEVLSPELTALNIKRTIHRLCGDLVVVDEKKGSVSDVHHTAKEFLIHDKGSELAIDPAEAHTLIFVKCLNILMDTQFRVLMKTHGCVGVLKYACIFWATHLACADHLNRQHLRTLAEFFKGECVQAWIEAVGLNGSLSVLTRTSKNLNLFVKRREQYEQEVIPMDRSSEECDFLALWSADLVRIVGKFGHHIVKYPDSIHNLIPRFCPPDSIMARQFVYFSPTALQVTGVSNTGWDDLLAKFNTSQTNQPDMIYCLDDFFAILASSNTVNMYSTSTFREIGKIGHGEVILAMKFSEDGDRLATCGKDTVKIWDVESGKRAGHFLNPEGLRAMDVAFDKKCCKVLVCYDDSSVRYMSLLGYNAWQTVPKVLPPASRSTSEPRYATPACASFSPDGTQVAISYRGIMPLRVWHTETGKLIGTLDRRGEFSRGLHSGACYAFRLAWNLVTGHVLGVYNEGSVFKWHPLEARSWEPQQPLRASELACCPDGKMFVTASRDGSLKVWTFEYFTLLYHCHVWEPNSLMRMAEMDDADSDLAGSRPGSTSFSLVSEEETVTAILDPINCLAHSRHGTAYAYSNEVGMLSVVLDADATKIEDQGETIMGVSCTAWSEDGQIATADIGGNIVLRSVT